MNHNDQAFDILEEWLRCSNGQTRALQVMDWPQVNALQSIKDGLEAKLRLVKPWQPGDAADSLLRELVEVESANIDLFASQKDRFKQQVQHIDRTLQSLARLRGSYVQSREPSWQSYS
jgi:hypothetical protein